MKTCNGEHSCHEMTLQILQFDYEISGIEMACKVSISCLMTGAVYIMKCTYHSCDNVIF